MVPLPSLSDDIAPIAVALDALRHDERVNWMRGLSKKELRAMYALAAASPPLQLSHFCDEDGRVVRHHGKNSLPVFCYFEKRVLWCDGQCQGYNHNGAVVTWFAGPGHFLASQDGGEVLLDYTRLPSEAPAGFPPLKPNDVGTAKLVFGGMIDRVRRVSTHCTIGTASRNGKPENAWFMLTREV